MIKTGKIREKNVQNTEKTCKILKISHLQVGKNEKNLEKSDGI